MAIDRSIVENMIGKIRAKGSSMTIKERLMLFFSILVIIPLLAVSLISYFSFTSYAENLMVKSKLDMSRSAMEEINIIKERDERVSEQVVLNNVMQEALIAKGFSDDLSQYEAKKKANDFLFSMMDTLNVSGIAVISADGKEYMTKNVDLLTIKDTPDVKEMLSNEAFAKSRGNVIWVPATKNIFISPLDSRSLITGNLYLYLIRKIYRLENAKQEIGICIVQFVYNRLETVLKSTASGKGEFCAVTDSSGVILCHTRYHELIGTALEDQIWKQVKNVSEGTFYNTIEGEKYMMLFIRNKASGWYIIQAVPQRNIIEESSKIQDFTLFTMVIFLFVAMVLSVLFSNNITGPIVKLKKAMEGFGAGNMNLRLRTDRNDEIGQLNSSFNYMSKEIRDLLDRIDEEHKQRRMLELSILEYQINPHFLYNTLDSINWMAQKSGQKEIGEMVTALARFFRIGLSKGKELIKLKDELEHASNYLIISKMRYKDCFRFQIDVPQELNECRTIKVILQPVLENCIKHGISKNGKNGIIHICGRLEDGAIVLMVTDNGKGIKKEKLEEVRSVLKENIDKEGCDTGIGLTNVNQRIKLNFGMQYGLDIDSEEGHWTKVTIKIPEIKSIEQKN